MKLSLIFWLLWIAIAAAVYSALAVFWEQGLDPLFYLLIIPVVWSAWHFPKRVYIGFLFVSYAVCFVYFFKTAGSSFHSDIADTTSVAVAMLFVCEFLHQAVRSQQYAHESLRKSEEKYRNIIDAAQDIIYTRDTEGFLLSMNKTFETRLGWPREEWVGRHFTELIHPEDLPKTQAHVKELIQSGRAQPIQVRIRAKSGEYRPVEVSPHTIWEDGRMIVQGIARDLSERLESQQALRESQELAEAAQRIAKIGFWRSDLTSGNLHWSSEVYEITGMDPNTFDHKRESFFQMIHPDDREHYFQALQETLKFKKPLHVQHRILLPDQSVKWLSEQAKPMADESGSVTQLVGTVQDITQQKQVEHEFNITYQKFRSLFEHAGDAILIRDAQARIVEANQEAYRQLGYDPGELIGANVYDVVDDSFHNIVPNSFQQLIKKGSVVINLRLKRKDGSTYPAEINARLVDFDGEPHIFTIIRDVSQREQIEVERKTFEEHLRHMQKMEAIGQLAGGVAHDFNNLLTAVIGNLNMAQISKPDTRDKFLQNALTAAQRSAELVQKLLAFSRKSVVNLKPLDVNQVIDEVHDLARNTIDRRIEFRVQKAEALPLIDADASQLSVVLMNLCLNARDALLERMKHEDKNPESTRYTIKIESGLKSGPKEHDHEMVCIKISDNGVGIEEDHLPKIYEPFFSTKKFGQEPGAGSGLGLSSAYGIIQQHNGLLECSSQLRRGTVFTISLPISRQSATHSSQISQSEWPHGRETILVVDDETLVLELAEKVLTSLDYSIYTARNGVEAVDLYKQYHDEIDLIILDLSMPKLSGTEVLKQVQTINPSVKVLICSGYAETVVLEEWMQTPHVAYIHKPFQPHELARQVRTLLTTTAH